MRTLGTFHLVKQAELTGCTRGSQSDDNFKNGCFEFKVTGVTMKGNLMKKVSDVKYYSEDAGYVTFVAVKIVKQICLHGPASLKDRTIIYPCERFKCRAGCPGRYFLHDFLRVSVLSSEFPVRKLGNLKVQEGIQSINCVFLTI